MPTIYDVAKEAGVSIGTVSYVINKSKKVRPQTVKRVEEAMRRLNYLPSASAKALALGRTDVISLVYPSTVIDFQMILNRIPIAIGEVLTNTDYRLNLLPIMRKTDIQELEASVQARLLDGVILLNTYLQDDRVTYLKNAGVPFVMIGRCLDNEGLYFVDANIEAASRLQVEHLYELGHRTIAYVGYQPLTPRISSISYRLQSSFIKALQDYGLPTDEHLFVQSCQPDDMVSTFEQLLHSAHPPTALAVADEASAMCVLNTAVKLGLKIPQELAIIGYAESPLYPLLSPSITVVFDKIMELGALAARMLLEILDGREPEHPQVLLEPELIVRSSTVS